MKDFWGLIDGLSWSSLCMKTEEYPYAEYSFGTFNPVQAAALNYVEEDCNVIVASPTSSGKTIAGELFGGKALEEEKKVVYLSPLKALVEEKVADWQEDSHPWHTRKLFTMTGDYEMSSERERELSRSDVIVSTYEMLAVRARRTQIEKGGWINQTGLLLVDEAHFIGSVGRGDHLENGLVSFTMRNSLARIIFLSATLDNAEQFGEWLTVLNNKPTKIINSTYRPCELNIHVTHYDGFYRGNDERAVIIEGICNLIEQNLGDQHLVFVHAKTYGRALLAELKETFPDLTIAYHNADLTKDQRSKIERNFRDRKIHVLIATSTLAYGVNLPARRVIIAGIKRGVQEVDPLDVIQECGRAGRPKYDDEGDAYVICPHNRAEAWESYLTNGVQVNSLIPHNLGFHLIGEIADNRVANVDEADVWAKRTLAYLQDSWVEGQSARTFDDFISHGIIKKDSRSEWFEDISEDAYTATKLGKIASHNYFDPVNVAAWKRNIAAVADRTGDLFYVDCVAAWMVCSLPRNEGFISNPMRDTTNVILSATRPYRMMFQNDASLADGAAVFHMMRGRNLDPVFTSIKMKFVHDIRRIISCMKAICHRCMKVDLEHDYWDKLMYRILYEVPTWGQAELCMLPGVGAAISKKLVEHNINSIHDFVVGKSLVYRILPRKSYKEAMSYAQEKIHSGGKKKKEVSLVGRDVQRKVQKSKAGRSKTRQAGRKRNPYFKL